ncbi:hypothetical protein D3C87_1031360 [compost metagenome]
MGELFQKQANLVPAGGSDVLPVAALQARDDQLQELRSLLLQVLVFEIAGGTTGFEAGCPFGKQLRLILLHRIESAGLQCRHET